MGDRTVVRLGDVGFFATGGTPSRKHDEYFHGDIPWVTTVALNGGHISVADAQQMITNEAIQHSATKLIRAGSILVGIRVGVGKVAITDVPMCSNQDIVAISDIDHSQWDIDYLCYAIRSQSYYLLAQKQGATISGISSKLLKSLEIECPSLERQHSIVSCLRMIESQIAIAEQMLAKTDELIQSRFVEMFGHEKYDSVMSAQLLTNMCNGISPSKKGTIRARVLTLSAITQGCFDRSAWKEGTFVDDPPSEKRVSASDFYMCRGNGNKGLVGTGAYAGRDYPDLVFPDTMIAGKVNTDKVCLPYLFYMWRRPFVRKQIEGMARTTNGTYKVNQDMLSRVKVPLPPLALQNEFAEFVTQVESLKSATRQQLDRLNTLYDSLAQRYFAE